MAVLAVFDFRGEPVELARRYDVALHEVAKVSSARPIIHLATPREYGFMVADVWDNEDVLRNFVDNEEFRHVLRDNGMPEPELRVYPIHNLGWPVDVLPLYR
jgi:hypothetical protein